MLHVKPGVGIWNPPVLTDNKAGPLCALAYYVGLSLSFDAMRLVKDNAETKASDALMAIDLHCWHQSFLRSGVIPFCNDGGAMWLADDLGFWMSIVTGAGCLRASADSSIASK